AHSVAPRPRQRQTRRKAETQNHEAKAYNETPCRSGSRMAIHFEVRSVTIRGAIALAALLITTSACSGADTNNGAANLTDPGAVTTDTKPAAAPTNPNSPTSTGARACGS